MSEEVKTDQKSTGVPADEPGVAKIKQQFLLHDYKPIVDTEYVSASMKDQLKQTDALENTNENATVAADAEPPAKKVKLTGRNKKRPKGKRIDAADKICPAIVRDQICSYGDRCKFSHDKQKFLETKSPDISGHCYMFDTYGKCPFGLACRFSTEHISADLRNIVKEEFDERKLTTSVKNVLKKENQVLLWKRKFDFSKADKIIDEMGCRNPKDKQRNRNSKSDQDKSLELHDKMDRDTVTESDQSPTGVVESGNKKCIQVEKAVNKDSISDIKCMDAKIVSAEGDNTIGEVEESNNISADKARDKSVVETLTSHDSGENRHVTSNSHTLNNNAKETESESHTDRVSEKAVQDIKSSIPLEENSTSDTDATSVKTVEVIDTVADANVGAHSQATDNEGVIRLRPQEKKKVNFADKLYLAPLTTVGNLPYRRICKGYGADITCGEMAVATNLLQGQASEWALLKRHQSEDLFGVQICGAYPDTMTRCAQIINDTLDVDFVDINCGCPIDLIFNKGEGSALMGRVSKFGQIVKGMTSVLDVPLTVKIRTGIYSDKNIAHTLVPKLRDWGVALTTIHGRSRVQRYTKTADWDYINECAKLAAPMPLFGNGDILSFVEANERREQTGVSGIMLARGALIKPWIFTEIKEQRHWDISASERFDMLRDYTNFGLEHWGSDQQGVESTRRFLLEWLSFLYRYIPVGLLERVPQRINERPPYYKGRNDLETLMASPNCGDWIKISEMLLGPVPDGFSFLPKHKANAYK